MPTALGAVGVIFSATLVEERPIRQRWAQGRLQSLCAGRLLRRAPEASRSPLLAGAASSRPPAPLAQLEKLDYLHSMFTVTADTILPCTVTGSWPRPRWFDLSMWGRPLDASMMDVRFREKFQDALAAVLNDQECVASIF